MGDLRRRCMEKLNSVEKAKIFDALDWSDICHKYEHRDPSVLAKDFIKSTIEAQTGLSISTAAFYTRISRYKQSVGSVKVFNLKDESSQQDNHQKSCPKANKSLTINLFGIGSIVVQSSNVEESTAKILSYLKKGV